MKSLLAFMLALISLSSFAAGPIEISNPPPSASGDADTWSQYPATQNVDLDGNSITNIYQLIDTNGTIRFDTDWGFDGDYPGRLPFGYLDAVVVSASNHSAAVSVMPSAFEPSGLVWHDADGLLYAVGDEGVIGRMPFDGVGWTSYVWSAGLDFEAVTVADPTSPWIEVGCERWLGDIDQDMIVRLRWNDALSNTNQWRFDVSQIVAATEANAGLEALTFIPSNAVPSWVPNTWSEPLGLFLASAQESGMWYLIDVPLSSTAPSTNIVTLTVLANQIAAWMPRLVFNSNRNDCADLYFDQRWNRLYAVYDEDDGELTDPTALSFRGRSIYMFDQELLRATQEWGLWKDGSPDNSPEGFSLGPDRGFCFIANDVGASADSSIVRYRFDAYSREVRRLLDVVLARDPTDDDDSSLGYSPGSMWVNTAGGVWLCASNNAPDAAYWVRIGLSGSGFPLTANGDLAGFSITQGATVILDGTVGAEAINDNAGNIVLSLIDTAEQLRYGDGTTVAFDLVPATAAINNSTGVQLIDLVDGQEAIYDGTGTDAIVDLNTGVGQFKGLSMHDGATTYVPGVSMPEIGIGGGIVTNAADFVSFTAPSDIAPATTSSTGTYGSMAYDANYLYMAIGTNLWRRVPLASW